MMSSIHISANRTSFLLISRLIRGTNVSMIQDYLMVVWWYGSFLSEFFSRIEPAVNEQLETKLCPFRLLV